MSTIDEIKKGMARAFFASAWSDACEESGNSQIMSGCEILDLIPEEIDTAALHAARTLMSDIANANTTSIETLYSLHAGGLSPEDWGHYAAMSAMSHGVGLWEYVGDAVRVPYVEFGSHSLEKDYF